MSNRRPDLDCRGGWLKIAWAKPQDEGSGYLVVELQRCFVTIQLVASLVV
jgi:hypothetical protein